MRYFKRYWDESRADAYDGWGCSWWWFETDDAGVVMRQVEIYDNGPTLRYDEHRLIDKFGGLSEQPLDFGEFADFEVPQEEFERVWRASG